MSKAVTSYSKVNLFGLILGPLLAFLVFFLIPNDMIAYEGRVVLSAVALIGTYWVTEAIPMAAASLIPLIYIPLFGGAPVGVVSGGYSEPVIFMYMGGFILAIAIEKWNLHRRIALSIIDFIGTESHKIILGIMLATGLLTMFISNAATALMMLPVALALISEVRDKKVLSGQNMNYFAKAILLAVAYTATIGGLATLVAAVPNAALAGIASIQFGVEVTFVQWLMFAGPVAFIMFIVLYFYLTKIRFKVKVDDQKPVTFIKEEKKKLGKIKTEEWIVIAVFLMTVSLWVGKPLILYIANNVGFLSFLENLGNLPDASISMFGAILLFFLPSTQPGERILKWEDLVKLPWGVLVLFGGGLALASSLEHSGVNAWIAVALEGLQAYTPFIIILLLVIIVLGMTEILSNTAVANLVLPISAGLGIAIGIDPLLMMAAVALAAGSCYMLPVATPPNTAVFSAGELEISDMARAGVWLNIVSVIVITLAVYYWMPVVFGIERP
ncbi:sodium/sulphate symporter [Bacillus sp. JCM 19046]|uniref:Sodium-dependent dicarboxylate transporter SdcS n=1 Tax=Shouchella xiaoxiensis TaxID=766895 RepID=A0ABS2STV1_9BACI|nr:SLC13 family permease [Shouchella xiaoxiensis]MBM7837894.1 sodium-dependent dicarboxylate transporter 2/3/5 [Shouchella xiaoxiensis]GAF12199.1 sodium/sulphate symporter [Bacillus sp. JCM 19045]GAF19158.1 sodium/sulphate symporter [Bacillus sp. JCM 19046]